MSACDIAELRGLFLFEALTDAQLTALCANSRVETFPAGELCREGEPAEYFYVLLDGEVRLSKRSGNRDTVIWRASEPGVWAESIPGDTRFITSLPLTVEPARS